MMICHGFLKNLGEGNESTGRRYKPFQAKKQVSLSAHTSESPRKTSDPMG